MAKIIDKSTAAERLIVAAIAMAEKGDDPLAIHVVASSALNLLRELIEAGGDNYVAQVLKHGVFAMASARIKGEPIPVPAPPEIDRIIGEVADGIKKGQLNQPSDLEVPLSPDELRGMLGYIIRPFNFLKHASRDVLATLDEEDVDPNGAIGHALAALNFVSPNRPLPDEIKPYLERRNLL
jgi:hypothetical protein